MITEKELKEDYVDQATAAIMLDVSRSRVNALCREGRFDGAIKAGWAWLIPKTAVETFKRLHPGRPKRGNTDRAVMENAIAESNKWKEIAIL